jgi:hypothetical protein
LQRTGTFTSLSKNPKAPSFFGTEELLQTQWLADATSWLRCGTRILWSLSEILGLTVPIRHELYVQTLGLTHMASDLVIDDDVLVNTGSLI